MAVNYSLAHLGALSQYQPAYGLTTQLAYALILPINSLFQLETTTDPVSSRMLTKVLLDSWKLEENINYDLYNSV